MRFVITILVALAGVWFWYDNIALLSKTVPINLRLPFVEIRPMPPHGPRIDVLLVIAFAGGFLLAYILGMMRRVRSAVQIRQLKKELKKANPGQSPAPAPAPTSAPTPSVEQMSDQEPSTGDDTNPL